MSTYACVLDASAMVALVLSEEEGPAVGRIVDDVIAEGRRILVPPLFWYEVPNAVLVAWRQGRLPDGAPAEILRDLALLPLTTDQRWASGEAEAALALAETHRLSYYDAAYLELAIRSGIRLKTLDSHLLNLRTTYDFIF